MLDAFTVWFSGKDIPTTPEITLNKMFNLDINTEIKHSLIYKTSFWHILYKFVSSKALL